MHDEPITDDGPPRSPFPYFGGKRRVADLVWSRLGDVQTYNEPFFGGGSVLLGRPHPPRVETVNDIDCFLANFWRALQHDPEAVAYWADSPVNEADLHARHRWLVSRGRRRVLRCMRDPEYFNSKIAGLWVWGQCLWIGSGWCEAARPPRNTVRPETGLVNSKGVHRQFDALPIQKPGSARMEGQLLRQRTAQSRSGENPSEQHKRFRSDGIGGVHADRVRRWQGGGQGGGSGVHAPTLSQQLPALNGDGGATGHGILASGFDLRTGGLYA